MQICDGVDYTAKLKSKNIISIAFINIPFIGGGTAPWGSKNAVGGFDAPKMWDGRVEVVGYAGTFSLMKAQVKSSALHAMRICQVRQVPRIPGSTLASLEAHNPPFRPAAALALPPATAHTRSPGRSSRHAGFAVAVDLVSPAQRSDARD